MKKRTKKAESKASERKEEALTKEKPEKEPSEGSEAPYFLMKAKKGSDSVYENGKQSRLRTMIDQAKKKNGSTAVTRASPPKEVKKATKATDSEMQVSKVTTF